PQRLNCARAESTFLPVLGVQPFLGRNFTAEEDTAAGDSVALVSFTLWRNHFGSDARVLGKHIVLDGKSARIVGVLPSTFETPNLQPVDLLVPRKLARERTRNVEIHVIGRLHPN